jgi:hypothetical protein
VPGPADITTTECVYPEKVVPASDLQALAARRIHRLVGRPTITTAPPGPRTLVNIPTLYSTTSFDPVILGVTRPVPGRLRADAEYAWTFTGGDHALGPGSPYTPAIDPLAHPDHYLHTIYRTAGPKRATLTLTWRVSFRLQDSLDVDLAPIVFTTSSATRAMTAHSELIDQPPHR